MTAPTPGIVAAGHPATAHAGRIALEAGGNAVDAAVAAAFASFTAESLLTDIGGGGYLMVADTNAARVYDFFVRMPGLNSSAGGLDLRAVPIDFGGTTQHFQAGLGTAAVPGNVHGLCTAHEREGRIPLQEVLAPAIALARDGVPFSESMQRCLDVIAPIFELTPSLAERIAPNGTRLVPGDQLEIPHLAELIEAIAQDGPRAFLEGEVAEAIVQICAEQGGRITRDDLLQYSTVVRPALSRRLGATTLYLNTAPSPAGPLIGLAADLLDAMTTDDRKALGNLLAVFHAVGRARAEIVERLGATETWVEKLAEPDTLDLARSLLVNSTGLPLEPAAPPSRGSTTHISVVDGEGMAASVTTSNGEGSGILVPGTGIHLNNMLGEEDVNPAGIGHLRPGSTLASMMCPMILDHADGTRTALGSGGSNRIRTALVQVVLGMLDDPAHMADAIEAPRIHPDGVRVHLEPGFSVADHVALEASGATLEPWSERHLYFGGVHGAQRAAHGVLRGHGDSRRGGVTAKVHAD